MPPLPNASLPLLLLKESSFLVPSVLSSGSNSVASFLDYALQMNSSVAMKPFTAILLACYTGASLKPPCSIRIREIVDSAIQIEDRFIREALPNGLTGMNAPLMGQYIRFCADHLLHELKQPSLYNVNNPFPWMDGQISLQGKTNFFEKKVGEYAKSGVGDPKHRTYSHSMKSSNSKPAPYLCFFLPLHVTCLKSRAPYGLAIKHAGRSYMLSRLYRKVKTFA